MNDLIDTTEMYLRIIFELEEENIPPLRARIAQRLNHSGPTVSQTIARMERDGLVAMSPDRHLELTAVGRSRAIAVMRRHRLAELLLINVIGLEYEQAHEEACKWEHVISDSVEKKIFHLLGNPTQSPYGNPIPGLEALDLSSGQDTNTATDFTTKTNKYLQADAVALNTIVTGPVSIVRIGEQLQADHELLTALEHAHIRTRTVVGISRTDSQVTLCNQGSGDCVTLTDEQAQLIYVAPVTS